MFPGLGVGRIVHYVLCADDLLPSHAHCVGEVIPAIVVHDWRADNGSTNLQGFPDGRNHGFGIGMTVWLTSRHNDESGKPGTWHWPPKV